MLSELTSWFEGALVKPISESKAIDLLADIRSRFARAVAAYETKASKCLECPNPGECCVDAHFVNVRITRLEAEAILRYLKTLSSRRYATIRERITRTIDDFGLVAGSDPDLRTFSCPLFEEGLGCSVHSVAKPLPCLAHACYESKSDLPPDDLLTSAEAEIADLNKRVYGSIQLPISLPVAIEARTRASTGSDG